MILHHQTLSGLFYYHGAEGQLISIQTIIQGIGWYPVSRFLAPQNEKMPWKIKHITHGFASWEILEVSRHCRLQHYKIDGIKILWFSSQKITFTPLWEFLWCPMEGSRILSKYFFCKEKKQARKCAASFSTMEKPCGVCVPTTKFWQGFCCANFLDCRSSSLNVSAHHQN